MPKPPRETMEGLYEAILESQSIRLNIEIGMLKEIENSEVFNESEETFKDDFKSKLKSMEEFKAKIQPEV